MQGIKMYLKKMNMYQVPLRIDVYFIPNQKEKKSQQQIVQKL